MNESTEELVKRLGSRDNPQEVRLPAWDELYAKSIDKQCRFFERGHKGLRGTHDPEEAMELTQELYFKIRAHLQEKPLDGTNPEGYIWRTAERLLWDYWRARQRRAREIPLEVLDPVPDIESLSPEEELDLKEASQRAVDLGLHLPNPKDRVLLSLNAAGFESKQILDLIPSVGSHRTVCRRLQNSKAYIYKHWERADEDLSGLSPWEEKLAFTDGRGALGINYLNNLPRNLAPGSLQNVCRHFEVKDLGQLAEVCITSLLLRNLGTARLEPRICFLPRGDVGLGILAGRRINYYEATPVFHTEKVKGIRRDLLYLEDQITYQARFVHEIVDGQGKTFGYQWLFDLPEGSLTVYKAFNPQVLQLYGNPHSREEALVVLRID